MQTEPLISIFLAFIRPVLQRKGKFPLRGANLEFHGRVLLVLWRRVALVVEVVGGGGVDDGRLLRRLVDPLAVDVDEEGEQARAQEAGDARGN